jgi:hypothetical protein
MIWRKTTLLSLLVFPLWLGAQADHDTFEDAYSIFSDTADWDTCGLTYSEECEPTTSIEQAACEAPLVVFGRVLETEESTNSIKIQVDYRGQAFGDQKKGIPKWGAGLENELEDSIFYGQSGFFTTWVTGFTNEEDTKQPDKISICKTKSPTNPQQESYFFLKALPENNGANITVDDNTRVLSVNFTLQTDVMGSGMVKSGDEAWQYVKEGIYNDDFKLEGDCDVVYCCYNPDCSSCADTLASYPDYRCTFEPLDDVGDQQSGAPQQSWWRSSIGGMVFGTVTIGLAL